MMTNNRFGFTLIELLVVIAVIGILAGIVTSSLSGARAKARDGERKSDVKELQTAIQLFEETKGILPGTAGQTLTSAAGAGWIPNLAPQYISVVPVDPKQSAVFSYVFARGSGLQDGAFYVETTLEGNDTPTLAADPGSDLLQAATFVTGSYSKGGKIVFRVSSGSVN